MKLTTACLLFLAFLLNIPFATTQNAGASTKPADVFVAEGVLKLAKLMAFDYTGNLEKAKGGDQAALKALFDFFGATDGIDRQNHALTCLELIPVAFDEHFSLALSGAKPKLKVLMLEQLQLAQGRTKKEALQKPLADWAPETWRALNGLPVKGFSGNLSTPPDVNPDDMDPRRKAKVEAMRKSQGADGGIVPAASPQSSPTDKEKMPDGGQK